jgi:signal transduction histidine kinase
MKNEPDFISLASHQLKTPITVVGLYADMLRKDRGGALSEAGRGYVETILRANRRMSRLVNALLRVSRLAEGSVAVSPVPTRLEALVATVVDGLRGPAEERKIRVTIVSAGDQTETKIDPAIAELALVAVIGNAIRYSNENGTVSVVVGRDGSGLTVEVSDAGIGIPKIQQKHIFSKLFRADNAQKAYPDGWGLDLFVAKSALERAGASMSFRSKERKGSTFTMRVPLRGMRKRRGTKTLAL